MSNDVRAINEMVQRESAFIDPILHEVHKVVVGQDVMIERVLIGLLTGGHILLEGVPGLAKTLTVNTICKTISAKFQRLQFTPDLLPADVIGTVIYNQQRGEFTAKKGPDLREPRARRRDQPSARPRCKAPCSKRCRSNRSPSATRPTCSTSPSW